MKFIKISDIILIQFIIRQQRLPNLKEAEMGEETEILEFKTSTAEIPAFQSSARVCPHCDKTRYSAARKSRCSIASPSPTG